MGGAGLRFQWEGPGIKEKRTVGGEGKGQKKAFDFTKGKAKGGAEDGSAVLFVERTGKQAGIKSEFFDFKESLSKIPDLSGRKPDFERIDENIGTDYKISGYVWPGLDDRFADTFASRHTGFLKITKAGKYTFYLSSDDGSKLWIDGALVIDNDGLQTLREMDPLPGHFQPNDGHYVMQEKSGSVDLKEGLHELRIEFFKNRGYD
ncbi:MAG: PA14 domain-containing protein, partial [bacterium]